MKHTQLIVALDVDTPEAAAALVKRIGPDVRWYKVGKQLFTWSGPDVITDLKSQGKNVFLDLKYHDIPNTVGQAVRAAAGSGATMTTVHAGGGPAMLRAAAVAGRETGVAVVAVTVLTSMDAHELHAVGINDTPSDQVLRLAQLARDADTTGVVCSAWEIEILRKTCGEDFVLVVPGIRPEGSSHGDQKRVMTPSQAAQAGADFIVVGRPITKAQDPAAVARGILNELQG